MDLFSSITTVVSLTLDILNITATATLGALSLAKIYGPAGVALYLFGNRSTWRLEAQVLGKLQDADAIAFRNIVQGQCNMISVAAAIIAQISITAVSLSNLSQTHWVTSGFLNFSLISALMAVYYSTTQYRILGRLLQPEQIRLWIRGGIRNEYALERIVPSLGQLADEWTKYFRSSRPHSPSAAALPAPGRPSTLNNVGTAQWLMNPSAGFRAWVLKSPSASFAQRSSDFSQPCDPSLFDPNETEPDRVAAKLRATCFTPSVSAVITMSAPQALLSASLFSLLISLGVYLGFVWTRDLDRDAGTDDSRNVFIMYLTSLGVCLVVYTLSTLIQDEDTRSEMAILNQHVVDYVQNEDHRDIVERWGYAWDVRNGAVRFYRSRARGTSASGIPGVTAAGTRSDSAARTSSRSGDSGGGEAQSQTPVQPVQSNVDSNPGDVV